jgi:hypothetical protein
MLLGERKDTSEKHHFNDRILISAPMAASPGEVYRLSRRFLLGERGRNAWAAGWACLPWQADSSQRPPHDAGWTKCIPRVNDKT